MSAEPGLVIVGQGVAGTAAAKAFREQDARTPVVMVSAEQVRCYSRPRLTEVVSGQTPAESICLHPPEWYDRQQITLLLGRQAVALDLASQRVVLDDGRALPFVRAILATGAQASWPQVPGLPSPHACQLRSLEDALRLQRLARGKKTALLVGGGLLGLEAGYALTKLGLKVTVLEAFPRLLPRQLDKEASDLLQLRLAALGFDFLLGSGIEQLEAGPDRTRLRLADGREAAADLLLVSAGIKPRSELAAQAGIKVARGVVVDDALQTSAAGVWAAGDVAEWNGQIAGLWPAAQAMGQIAGRNAAGSRETYQGWVPSTKLKVAGVDVWSQGDIRDEDARVYSRLEADQGRLTKLFVRDDRLAGSIQVGHAAGAVQFKRLIEGKLALGGRGEALLEEGFDFSSIPGFQDS